MRGGSAISIEELRQAARRRLPRFAFDFIDGGAEDEITLRRNREAFRDIAFSPQVLCGVARRRLETSILGGMAAMPIAISPTGMAAIAWPGGELGLVRAARTYNIPFTLSTQSSVTLEAVAREGGRLWFQLYHFRDRELVAALVRRALDAGYEALVLTVDVPVPANRERDKRNGFDLPLRPGPRMALDIASHPGWALDLLRHGLPNSANVPRAPLFSRARTEAHAGATMDASLCWEDAARLRDLWPKPLVLKGVLSAQDAVRAAGLGFDGVIVSNHGGRQLDGAPATIEVLPEIVAAAGERLEVMIDSGFRRGADVVKAVALGAKAALVGRATLFGLAAAGQAGAEQALKILRADLHRTMALLGCCDVQALDTRYLRPRK